MAVDAEETDAVDAGDLYEYTFKTNVGNRLLNVLKALQIKSPCWLMSENDASGENTKWCGIVC